MTSCQPQKVKAARAGKQPHLAGPLDHVVRRGKQSATAKRKNHRIGMQRTQTAIAPTTECPSSVRANQLRGDENTDQHASHPHTTVMMANCRTTVSLCQTPSRLLICKCHVFLFLMDRSGFPIAEGSLLISDKQLELFL